MSVIAKLLPNVISNNIGPKRVKKIETR